MRVVVTSSVGVQIIEYLRRKGEHRGVFSLAQTLQISYPWAWKVLRNLERQGVVAIDRSTKPYIIRLSEETE